MLKITFGNKDTENKELYAIVNGVSDFESKCYDDGKSITIMKKEVSDILTSYRVSEIAQVLDYFSMVLNVDWWKFPVIMTFFLEDITDNVMVNFEMEIKANFWSEGWSIANFDDALIKSAKNLNIKYDGLFNDDIEFGFSPNFYISDINSVAADLISDYLKLLDQLVSDAKRLCSLNDDKAVISLFDFPENIRVSCHQYLMYFTQFLKDLDIEANSEISQEGRSTLFKVEPQNKNEALDQIKEALEVYINAPALTDLQFQTFNNNNVAYLQLQANVMHLKSQIMLSHSALQMKDATIEALQLSNYQLKHLLDIAKKSEKEEEEIIPGIVTLKKYDGKWFSINLPTLLNKLKRKIEKQ